MGHAGSTSDFTLTTPAERTAAIVVNCEVDTLTTPALRELLTGQFESGDIKALVVDFTGCGFLGSSGLAALVEARERSQTTGVTLILAGLNRVLTRALDATGLSGMFTVAATLDDAVAQLPA